jgi:uroporphyrinogen-III synthase
MSQLDKALEAKLRSAPDARVRVIVRTVSSASQYAASLESLGLRVLHVSTLINATNVEGPAEAILKLSGEDWVVALESDGSVHTMGNQ